MSNRSYPYKAWALTPSFKPVEVELVNCYGHGWQSIDYGDLTATGKFYAIEKLHASKALAIAAGWAAVEAQQAKLDKMSITLGKKRAALNKAANAGAHP